MKKTDLESMTLDDLWSLHEEISKILLTRIQIQKTELEKRLAVLDPSLNAIDDPTEYQGAAEKQRRKYPQVVPKYRNPQTLETWSGRGKRPRWLAAAMERGHSLEEFRISQGRGRH